MNGVPGASPSIQEATLRSVFAAAMLPCAIRRECVRVGLARIGDWQGWRGEAHALLDAHERARVSRQRLPHERDARTLAYALHRLWLAHALGCDAVDVPLYRDADGCPRLVGDIAWTSLSHAGGLLAFAAGGAGPVGVDIEPASRARVMDEIAGEVCHPDDMSHRVSPPQSMREAALLELWVRKEAVLKAAGVGLRIPMTSFAAWRREPVRVPGFAQAWQVRSLDAGPGAVAAVAFREHARVECAWLRPAAVAVPACAPAAHAGVS